MHHSTLRIRLTLFLGLLLALPLTAQKDCYGSFEAFGAAGVSNTDVRSDLSDVDYDPVAAYRFGFGASFAVGQRTLLRTTMQFTRYGDRQRIESDGLRWGTQHDGTGGFDPAAVSRELGFSDMDILTQHLYVEFGVGLRYYPRVRSWVRPFGEAGLNVARYGTTVRAVNTDERTITVRGEETFRNWSPIGRLGAGVDLPFNEYIGVYGMAVYQRHLRSVNAIGSVRVRPWQASLELGVRIFVDPR